MAEHNMRFDNECKKILTNKDILANIMLGCLEEYRGVGVYEISDRYIEGNPKNDVPILEQPPQIVGNSNEFNSFNEGRSTFDVTFMAGIPNNTGEELYLMLDVEAQNNANPGYPILKRGSFYCGRMIVSQYGSVFVKSDYGKLRKVVSMWLCPFPSKKEQEYTINVYRMKETHIVGDYGARKEDYDNFCMVVIFLGNKKPEELTGLMRFLTVLFVSELPAEEVTRIIRDEYHVRITPDIEKGVAKLCNLSEGIRQRAEEKGRKEERSNFFNAMNLIKNNTPLDDVSKTTGIDLSSLQSMRDMMFAR